MKKKSIFIIAVLMITVIESQNTFSQNQNVAINTDGSLPANSAMLDISATDKGILIPRITSTQRDAIVSPATGLMVYDNSLNQFWYFNGIEWTAISGATSSVTFLNDLSDVNAIPSDGDFLQWNGSEWAAIGGSSGGGTITAFTWDDPTNLLTITEAGVNWDATIDNEADDLSDNFINDLSDVNASPSNGDLLQWSGTEWVAGSPSGSSCVTLDEAYDCGGTGAGRTINVDGGSIEFTTSTANKTLLVNTSANNSFAISAEHSSIGVTFGAGSTSSSNSFSTIQATTISSDNTVSAVLGSSTGGAWSVSGQIESGASAGAGVYGTNFRTNGGHGVLGVGLNGVVGQTNYLEGYGVYGSNSSSTGSGDGVGVYGVGNTGVMGQTTNGEFYGIYGENLDGGATYNNIGAAGWGWVGVFGQTSSNGFGVYSDGELGASGAKSFVIDHPLDPENKTLKHYCTESPEVLNIYRGNVFLNKKGEAKIELPEYFSEINIDFTYYLTPIGGAAPNLHVKTEVINNYFEDAGGTENLKVSWVLYAKRNDKYMQDKRQKDDNIVEQDKRQKGKYIHPKLYGQPETDGLFYKE